jgi:hypothetical protein
MDLLPDVSDAIRLNFVFVTRRNCCFVIDGWVIYAAPRR